MPGLPEELVSFVTKMGGERALKVEETLGSGFVRLRVAEAERRQARHDVRCVEDIVIEMLRNARDANARHVFVATWREGNLRTITMLDDGEGIPVELWDRVFDARVTSKLESVHMDRWGVHGRGMALYSVRENAVEAKVEASVKGGGTSIRVVSDAGRLSERKDQSTWPKLTTDEDGMLAVGRGPHNIYRTCCEFALEEQQRCAVYVGSAAEMVATMRRRIRPSSEMGKLLSQDLHELPVLERFSVAADARELCDAARDCGLGISERTAQRIIAGQIAPVRSALSHLGVHQTRQGSRGINLERDRRGLRLSDADRREFAEMMEQSFAVLAERYYLTLTDEPHVRLSNGRLTVSFDFESED